LTRQTGAEPWNEEKELKRGKLSNEGRALRGVEPLMWERSKRTAGELTEFS